LESRLADPSKKSPIKKHFIWVVYLDKTKSSEQFLTSLDEALPSMLLVN